jgi:hypothetical protein
LLVLVLILLELLLVGLLMKRRGSGHCRLLHLLLSGEGGPKAEQSRGGVDVVLSSLFLGVTHVLVGHGLGGCSA